jgi:hypothetical protein
MGKSRIRYRKPCLSLSCTYTTFFSSMAGEPLGGEPPAPRDRGTIELYSELGMDEERCYENARVYYD